LVPGAIIQLTAGSPAPVGFTKIGSVKYKYDDTAGQSQQVVLDVYVKN
jgi:hypothetical protein